MRRISKVYPQVWISIITNSSNVQFSVVSSAVTSVSLSEELLILNWQCVNLYQIKLFKCFQCPCTWTIQNINKKTRSMQRGGAFMETKTSLQNRWDHAYQHYRIIFMSCVQNIMFLIIPQKYSINTIKFSPIY
jgi:hypothetical protein